MTSLASKVEKKVDHSRNLDNLSPGEKMVGGNDTISGPKQTPVTGVKFGASSEPARR